MIEFRTKPFDTTFEEACWEPINNVHERTQTDFEFSYCDYRIGDDIFTEICPKFTDALQKEQFWMKLHTTSSVKAQIY